MSGKNSSQILLEQFEEYKQDSNQYIAESLSQGLEENTQTVSRFVEKTEKRHASNLKKQLWFHTKIAAVIGVLLLSIALAIWNSIVPYYIDAKVETRMLQLQRSMESSLDNKIKTYMAEKERGYSRSTPFSNSGNKH